LDIDKYQSLSDNKKTKFRKANFADKNKIQNDIYPYLDGYGENDKKYLEEPESHTIFISEKEKKIIHYFLVFEDAQQSPLIKTPINKKFINNETAYLGSAFTVPEERGLWITIYSVAFIIKYLKQNTDIKKVLLLVHDKTSGAIEFYQRLGFHIIPNAAPKNVLQWLLDKIKP